MPTFFSKRLIDKIGRIIIVAVTMCFTLLPLATPAYAATAPGYVGIQPAPLIDIRDVINVKGPANTTAVASVPTGPLEVQSNAVDVAALAYEHNNTSFITAAILGLVTVDSPYSHTYAICNRASGFTLDDAYTMGIPDLVYGSTAPPPQFWYISMSKKGVMEKAFTFSVYVNEANKTFTVDSFWVPRDAVLPKNPGFNYILNFQVVAISQQDADNLLHNILSKLANYGDGWQVKYINTQPVKPSFLVEDANLLQMKVQNYLPQAQKVSIKGWARYTSDKKKQLPFSFDRILDPGLNIIKLPFGYALDDSVTIQSAYFKDGIYVGSGYWLAFNNIGKSITMTEAQTSASDINSGAPDDMVLGSAGIQGKVIAKGWGGLARTLNPNSLPVDISKYKYLFFQARGDGKSYSVQLETEALRNLKTSDFPQYVITTGPEWRQYAIPLSDFKQLGTDPAKIAPFTGTDVISVAWETIDSPLDSVSLEIKDAAFINNVNPGINLTIGSSEMSVNRAVYDIDPGYQTVPSIINGRTFVPIRAIVERLGGTVDWSASDHKATIKLNNTNIVLTIGQQSAAVNGVDKTIDAAPFISATGRTMLPLRFIAENLGHSVNWDDSSKTITIQ